MNKQNQSFLGDLIQWILPAPTQSTTQPAAVDHNRVSSTVHNEGPTVLIPAPPQSTTQPTVVDHNRVSSTVQNKGPAVLIPAPPLSTNQPAVVVEVPLPSLIPKEFTKEDREDLAKAWKQIQVEDIWRMRRVEVYEWLQYHDKLDCMRRETHITYLRRVLVTLREKSRTKN